MFIKLSVPPLPNVCLMPRLLLVAQKIGRIGRKTVTFRNILQKISLKPLTQSRKDYNWAVFAFVCRLAGCAVRHWSLSFPPCRSGCFCPSCRSTSLMRCWRAWSSKRVRKRCSNSIPCICTGTRTSGTHQKKWKMGKTYKWYALKSALFQLIWNLLVHSLFTLHSGTCAVGHMIHLQLNHCWVILNNNIGSD